MSIALMNVNRNGNTIEITASLSRNGGIHIAGCDFSKAGDAMTGADCDFEYWLSGL